MELIILIVVGLLGIVIAGLGLVKAYSLRMTEPKQELQEKLDQLEKEVQELKNQKWKNYGFKDKFWMGKWGDLKNNKWQNDHEI